MSKKHMPLPQTNDLLASQFSYMVNHTGTGTSSNKTSEYKFAHQFCKTLDACSKGEAEMQKELQKTLQAAAGKR